MADWNRLDKIAREEVLGVLESLPSELRARSRHLPVTCELRPNQGWIDDGVEPDTLGLFVGEAFPDGAAGTIQLPPQIILFVGNLWDCADGSEELFREEIRTTYLHELGHYLGLDESDLEERGLD